jgi:hypothetical protein
MKIRPLKTFFTRQGFLHSLVSRDGDVAIFSRSKNRIQHFEVIRVRSSKLHPNDENKDRVDRVETYPPDKKWGKLGFTYPTRKEADAKASRMAIAASP